MFVVFCGRALESVKRCSRRKASGKVQDIVEQPQDVSSEWQRVIPNKRLQCLDTKYEKLQLTTDAI